MRGSAGRAGSGVIPAAVALAEPKRRAATAKTEAMTMDPVCSLSLEERLAESRSPPWWDRTEGRISWLLGRSSVLMVSVSCKNVWCAVLGHHSVRGRDSTALNYGFQWTVGKPPIGHRVRANDTSPGSKLSSGRSYRGAGLDGPRHPPSKALPYRHLLWVGFSSTCFPAVTLLKEAH